jgi:hypothetical protein
VEIADRLDKFRKMLEWEGRTDMPIWSVAQAFGNQRCGLPLAYEVQIPTFDLIHIGLSIVVTPMIQLLESGSDRS